MMQTDAHSTAAADAEAAPVLRVEDLHKHYRIGREDLAVLRGVDLRVDAGKWVCIFGRSGSGKSTLLHLLGGLDTPAKGRVWFQDQEIFKLSTARRDRFRSVHVGFVFQFYHLLPELNVLENTTIAGMVHRSIPAFWSQRRELRQRAREILGDLGLGDRLKHRPNELSGGERQRVAIARALLNRPDVLLADEPTGNLDRDTGQTILDLFARLRREGQTIVMVTHDELVAERADRIVYLERGRVVEKPTDAIRGSSRG